MITVNNANCCLQDDVLFVGEECPKCLGRSYYPLKKWLKPLHSFASIREERHEEHKKRNLQAQIIREGNILSADRLDPIGLLSTEEFKHRIAELQSRESAAAYGDSERQPSQPWPRKGDNTSGEQVATKCSISKRSHWFDASHALYCKVADWFLKRRLILSGKKYIGGYCNPEVLSEDEPEFASRIGKVFWRKSSLP